MNYQEFKQYFISLHPQPTKPRIWGYLFRVDFILLTLAAIGGVGFSAFRTFTVIAEQSGKGAALFAIFALELSMAGLILGQARKSQSWFIKSLRSGATWITISILLLILVVTNASYEIAQVGLAISEQGTQIVLVLFLGVMIPLLVVVNLENLATRVPEYMDEYRQAVDKFYADYQGWHEQLEEGWEAEQVKEYAEDRSLKSYSKQERREFIADQMEKGVSLNKTKLANKFNVSTTTIHNDVKDLTIEEDENQF